MEFNMFCKSDSGNDIGTTKASMNRTRKTNASAGPKKKYNEYKELHQCELEAHICSAFMEMTGMEDTTGINTLTQFCSMINPLSGSTLSLTRKIIWH